MTLTSIETEKLASFRRAARQVREASIIAQGERIQFHVAPGAPGYVDVFVELLGHEPFRSLALAIRLVYQQGEPAHFYSICNLSYREGADEVKAQIAAIRAQYGVALRDTSGNVAVDTDSETVVFTTEEALGHWLYGIAFHQDPERQASVQQLASAGARFAASVQATSLQLAGRILDLDDVVADILREPRLPRIEPAA